MDNTGKGTKDHVETKVIKQRKMVQRSQGQPQSVNRPTTEPNMKNPRHDSNRGTHGPAAAAAADNPLNASSASTSSSSSTSASSASVTDEQGGAGTGTLFQLKWNNYHPSLANVFRAVRVSHQYADITLACDGESFKCHRILLAACSPYFEKLFQEQEHDEPNGPNLVILINKGVKSWELQALLDFMYNGVVNVKGDDQLAQLINAGKLLSIRGFVDSPPTSPPPPTPTPTREIADKQHLEVDEDSQTEIMHSATANHTQLDLDLPPVAQVCQELPKVNNHRTRFPGDYGSGGGGQIKRKLNFIEPAQVKKKIQKGLAGGEEPQEDERTAAAAAGAATGVIDKVPNEGSRNVQRQPLFLTSIPDTTTIPVLRPPPSSRYPRIYDPKLEEAAMDSLANGVSIRLTSTFLGIPRKTLAKWLKAKRELELGNGDYAWTGDGELEPGAVDGGDGDRTEPEEQISQNPEVKEKEPPADIQTSEIAERAEPSTSASAASGTSKDEHSRQYREVKYCRASNADRAEKLASATAMVLKGSSTTRQAAEHFDIPRSSLCAYMKRGARTYSSTTGTGATGGSGTARR